MSAYSIRAAKAADVPTIIRIHAGVARGSITKGAPGAAQSDGAGQTTFWKEAVEYAEPQLFVACAGQEVVGFVGIDRSRDPRTPPTMGEIWYLYLAPEHHGRGAGLALWDSARETLIEEGCTQVSVWVPLASERALRFFELAGFKREMSTARTTAVPGGGRVEEVRLKRPL